RALADRLPRAAAVAKDLVRGALVRVANLRGRIGGGDGGGGRPRGQERQRDPGEPATHQPRGGEATSWSHPRRTTSRSSLHVSARGRGPGAGGFVRRPHAARPPLQVRAAA